MKQQDVPWSGDRAGPVIAVAAWMAAFILSCLSPAAGRREPGGTLLDRLAGGLRRDVGSRFFMTADRYFHRGIGHARETALQTDWFQQMRDRLIPSGHVHLDPDDTRAIMPWLRFATRLDPSNVDAYLTVAHWLRQGLNRGELARAVLAEAVGHNPRSTAVRLELARVYLTAQDAARARLALDAGLRIWPGTDAPDSPEARHDLAALLLYRAWLREQEGDLTGAAADLEMIVTIFPARLTLRDAAGRLRQGQPGLTQSPGGWQGLEAGHDQEPGGGAERPGGHMRGACPDCLPGAAHP